MSHYPDVEANPDFATLEEGILTFWQENRTFERSVEQRDAANAFVFYDGPPFANGLPHYGHLLTGYVKDAIARYQTMRGKRVERRFGWDCHGLPAEMGAEKELGITGRAAIMDYGIDKFNAYCQTSVMKYTKEWEYYVTRQGRWVDFKNDYKTMDEPFMESVLWAFSELYKKGLVYEAFRVMPYSWAAETPMSNFETRMDNATREREDKAAYVKFKLKDKPQGVLDWANNQNIVAWTTTPWTLPSNLALAVGNSLEYASLYYKGENYIVAKGFVASLAKALGITDQHQLDLLKDSFQFPPGHGRFGLTYVLPTEKAAERESVEGEMEVSETSKTRSRFNDDEFIAVTWLEAEKLVGLTYEPLFPYFAKSKNSFRVLAGDFVGEGDGTGVVHIAPGFGEDDYKLGQEHNIPTLIPVDEKGRFTAEIFDLPDLKLQGLTVVPDTRIAQDDIKVSAEDKAIHISEKDVAKYGLANMRIVRWLKAHGALVKDEPYKHNYPHCWRTDTPLIYRAMSSWYVNVQAIKEKMAANNQAIRWIPDHVRDGQMGKGIESAPDWSISRNRFWGTPIPIWRSASGKLIVAGSIAELEKLSGQKVKSLHRPDIDTIVIERDGEKFTRVEDVFDCWFESGSMPYAQLHYPFENKEKFEKNFPADFITEYIAQTRGWFYTLQVLSAALFECAPFKNVICHGVVIDEETGLKYSKRLKNYRDPKEVMDQYGADALRWMMLASPVMRGADLAVDPDGKFIRDIVRLHLKPIWNAYNFFTLYANADVVKAKAITTSDNMLDRYILAKARGAVEQVKTSLDAYDTPGATEAISGFFEVLNNWYIRRSRPRFWGESVSADKQAAYDTLFTVLNLLVTAAAPLLPFLSEAVYRGLNGEKESVHLQDFPEVSKIDAAEDLVGDMDRVRDACTAMLSIRSAENIRTRQPLASATIYGSGMERLKAYADLMSDELNVKAFHFSNSLEGVAEQVLTIHFPVAGKRLGGKMKQVAAAAKAGKWSWEDGAIVVDGEVLEEGEYNLQLKSLVAKGASPLSSNDALVVLDLTITPELEAEGLARDLVRMIQQARKDAGLHVADRIALTLDLPGSFKPAMAHKDYIAEQVLATSLGEGKASGTVSTQEIDGEKVTIGIAKAA